MASVLAIDAAGQAAAIYVTNAQSGVVFKDIEQAISN